MLSKAFAWSTVFVAILAFGPSHTAHAGPPPTGTSDPVAAATAEQPKSAEVKAAVAPIDSTAMTTVNLSVATVRLENGILTLTAGANANCAASQPKMSFVGQELFAGGKVVTATKILSGDGCVCNRGDVCCCSAGWTCCNHDGRCCCSTIINE